MNYKGIIFLILLFGGSLYYIASSYLIPYLNKNKNDVDYQAYQVEQIMKY